MASATPSPCFIAGGQRVELNEMSSAEIVAFVERKLEQHGVTKVVPDTVTLAAAWARARKAQEVNRLVATVNERGSGTSARRPAPSTRTYEERACAVMVRSRRAADGEHGNPVSPCSPQALRTPHRHATAASRISPAARTPAASTPGRTRGVRCRVAAPTGRRERRRLGQSSPATTPDSPPSLTVPRGVASGLRPTRAVRSRRPSLSSSR